MEIEGYDIGEVLSRGKAAVVYRARQQRLDRPVALKIQDAEQARQPEAREAFREECRRLSGLLHPHLVSGLATGEVDGRPYLVLEHVEGRTLEALVRSERPFREDRALRVGRQIARALAYLEREGLVHGDLAPGSILVTADDLVKVARMSLVRESGWDGRNRHREPAGTPGYMSPEQATNPGRVDIQSNLYSLGAVLYFVLTGRSPAEDVTAEVIDGRVVERPPSLRQGRSDLGRAVQEIVARLLEPDPGARPRSAAQAVDAIEGRLAEMEVRTRVQPGRGVARKTRVKRIRQARSTGRPADRKQRPPR